MYFFLEYGLRGAYCDGNGYIVKCDTRRDLKRSVEWEADSLRDAGMVGASKRAVASFTADLWRRGQNKKDRGMMSVMPICNNRGASYAWGIHGAPSCRADYLASQEGN